MGTPNKYSPEFCEIAKGVLAGGESIVAVAAELDVGRSTVYEWIDNHPEFKRAVEIGLSKCQRDWERLGRNGIEGKIDKFSGTSWIFTMKNRFRDDYKEDKEVKSVSETIVEKLIDKLVD